MTMTHDDRTSRRSQRARAGQRLPVRASGIDEAGLGVGHAHGLEIAAPDLLPGEQAEVRIEHTSRHRARAWARVLRRLGLPAPDRVSPPCPGFGHCGGCAWQHLAYASQLAHKRDRVIRALAATGLDVPVAPALAAPEITGYRNKGKYVIASDRDGLVLGAYAPRSHRVVNTLGCQVVEPAIDRVARAAREVLARSGLPVYDEGRHQGALRYAILRSGAHGTVLVGLVTSSQADGARVARAARELGARPDVAGVVWLQNDRPSSALLDPRGPVACLAGRPTVTELVAGPGGPVAVELGIGDFFQVNRAQAARLYTTVAEQAATLLPAAREPARIIDLYSGVGGIAFGLAGTGARVLGVESAESAVQAARAAATAAGLAERVGFHAGDAADLGHLAEGGVDLVVVNPPRKGLHPDARAALMAAAPPGIVYVSCGPESLARDLAVLCQAGWRIERVLPVDLMPGTAQIETVVALRRAGPGARGT